MRPLTKHEKAALLGEDYGLLYFLQFMHPEVPGATDRIHDNELLNKAVGDISENKLEWWVFQNLGILYGDFDVSIDKIIIPVHMFSKSVRLCIDAEYNYFIEDNGDKKYIDELNAIPSKTKSPPVSFVYNDTKIIVEPYKDYFTMTLRLDNLSYFLPSITTALKEFANQEVYIDGDDVFIPKALKHHKDIALLLSARNPKIIQKKQASVIIYKDTGITLEYIKSKNIEISTIFNGHGRKPKKTKLRISETEELFNIFLPLPKKVKTNRSDYNIYTL